MKFEEYVGNYHVLTSGDIQVFNGEMVEMRLEEGDLTMRFEFIEDNNKKGEITKDISDRVLTWKIYYYNEILSYTLITQPIEIGTDNKGGKMYFSFYVNYLNSNEKNWTLKYTFWNNK